MFEVDRHYRIITGTGENEGYSTFKVVAYEAPLLKVTAMGQELVLNTSSPSFVSAEKIPTPEEEQGRWTDFPEHLLPPAPPSS